MLLTPPNNSILVQIFDYFLERIRKSVGLFVLANNARSRRNHWIKAVWSHDERCRLTRNGNFKECSCNCHELGNQTACLNWLAIGALWITIGCKGDDLDRWEVFLRALCGRIWFQVLHTEYLTSYVWGQCAGGNHVKSKRELVVNSTHSSLPFTYGSWSWRLRVDIYF